MKKALIVDTSVFITYIRYNKLYRLIDAINKYEINVFVNQNLLNGIERNINKNVDVIVDSKQVVNYISENCILFETIPAFTQSPDPKDNFLFDLAIQTNSEILVTQEKALLNFENSPVKIHDLKWFKETYRVAL